MKYILLHEEFNMWPENRWIMFVWTVYSVILVKNVLGIIYILNCFQLYIMV
jgi:hypothetical protein